MTGDDRDDFDTTAPSAHDVGTDDGIGRIVAALHDHVGLQHLDERERRVVIEENNTIDTGQRGDDARPVGGSHDRAIGAFAETPR